MGKNKQTKPKQEVIEYQQEPETAIVPQNQNPASLIALAIQQGTPVETMEKLMDLQDRWEAKQAKKAFDDDMASFQSECPIIKKNKGVPTKSGKEAYKYATIDSIISQVRATLQKHGFSYSIQTETLPNNMVKATCVAKHKLGHSESSSMEVPLGTKTEIMSQSQVVAAAITFAKRYAFLNAFGIMTGDEDKEEVLKEGDVAEKKDTTNYIDKLKMALYKKGGKTLPAALEIYNTMTGLNATAMPANNDEAKEMFDNLINSPAFNQ